MATSINQLKRIRTWIEGFDPLVDGGIPRPSFVLLAGHPGTGKSTFGLQFLLNGLKHDNDVGVYASFLETQEVFIRNMSSNYGFDLDIPVKEGKLRFLEYTPLSMDASVDMLNEIVKTVVESGAKRLVIDSINALFGEIPAAEQRRMLEIVINKILKGAECTVIGIIEQSIGKKEIGLGIEEFVADGLILFESYSDGLEIKKRAVIRKMRGSIHSSHYQGIMLRPSEGISFFQLAE
jgi:circadian clock protein KaiC